MSVYKCSRTYIPDQAEHDHQLHNLQLKIHTCADYEEHDFCALLQSDVYVAKNEFSSMGWSCPASRAQSGMEGNRYHEKDVSSMSIPMLCL